MRQVKTPCTALKILFTAVDAGQADKRLQGLYLSQRWLSTASMSYPQKIYENYAF